MLILNFFGFQILKIKQKDETQISNLRNNRSYFNNDDEFETNIDSSGSDFILKSLIRNDNRHGREKWNNSNDHQNQRLLSENEND